MKCTYAFISTCFGYLEKVSMRDCESERLRKMCGAKTEKSFERVSKVLELPRLGLLTVL